MDDFIVDNLIGWYGLRIIGCNIRLAAGRIRLRYLKWRRMRNAKQA